MLLLFVALALAEPKWLTDYVLFHNRMRNNASARYLVYDCVRSCGGIADRLRGVVVAFYAAIITNRVVLVRMKSPKPLTTYLNRSLVDWSWPSDLNRNCDIEHNDFGRFPRWLPEMHNQTDVWSPHKVACIQTNHLGAISAVLTKTGLFPESRMRPIAAFVGTAFRTLFTPSEAVWARLNNLTRANGLPSIDPAQFLSRSREFWIGAHVRNRHGTGVDGNFRLPQTRHTYDKTSVDALIGCLKAFANATDKIYIAADSATVKSVITHHLPRATYSNIPILHFDMQLDGDHTWTWADFLLLAHASCIIGADFSGFSMFAAYLSERLDDHRPRCYVPDVLHQLTCAQAHRMMMSERTLLD